MEETIVGTPQVTFDYCSECDAVVRSDQACEHQDLEWLGLIEW